MKKHLLNFTCLMILAVGIYAQDPSDPKVSSPETQSSNDTNNLRRQLKEETAAREALERSLQEAKIALSNAEKKCSEEVKKYSKMEEVMSEIQKLHPLIVKKMEMGSFDEYEQKHIYGSELYGSDTKYLCLKMEYISLLNEQEELQFDITLYYPEKKISFTTQKNNGYSEKQTINPGNGTVNFKCREGIHNARTYPAGEYSIEIRYKGVFLGKKNFEIK